MKHAPPFETPPSREEEPRITFEHSVIKPRLEKTEQVRDLQNQPKWIADYYLLRREAMSDQENCLTMANPDSGMMTLVAYEGDVPVGAGTVEPGYCNCLKSPGLYIDTVYVTQAARTKGVGTALIKKLIQLGRETFPGEPLIFGTARVSSQGILARLGFQAHDDPELRRRNMKTMVLQFTDADSTAL